MSVASAEHITMIGEPLVDETSCTGAAHSRTGSAPSSAGEQSDRPPTPGSSWS